MCESSKPPRVVGRNLPMLVVLAAGALWAAPPGIGHTTRVIRSADLLRGKSTTKLKENDVVEENDRIRTQSSGRVRVVLNDSSILSVGASSLLTVRATTASSRAGSLEMAYGRLRAIVTSTPKSTPPAPPFEVRTATAVCGVLGTTLFVDSSRDLTRIANLSDDANSRVRVVSSNPQVTGEVILLPGQGTSVPASGAPLPPRRWSPEEVRAANADTEIP
jgi:ferric-dicitrate binding protein FerR (iron transport regulator)